MDSLTNQTSSYDYSSFYVSVFLIDRNLDEVQLWSNIDNNKASRGYASKGGKSLSYVTGVMVSMGLAFIPKIQVNMTMPYKEGIAFLDSNLIEYLVNHIRVEYGYRGGPSYSVMGLTQQPTVNIGSEISITLTALGAFSVLTGNKSFSRKNSTRRQLIEELLTGSDPDNPRKIKLDDTETDNLSKNLLNQIIPNFYSDLKADWHIIHTLAAQCYCTAFFDTSGEDKTTINRLRLVSRSLRFSKKVSKIFSMNQTGDGGSVGPSSGVFPILSVSVNNAGVFIPGSIRSIVNQSVDMQTRKPTREKLRDVDIRTPRVGDSQGFAYPAKSADLPGSIFDYVPAPLLGSVPDSPGTSSTSAPTNTQNNKDTETEVINGVKFLYGEVNRADIASLIKDEAHKFSAALGVRLELSTIGAPDCFPADLIDVRGLSSRYDYKYSITTVTHTFGPDGFNTIIEAFSNIMAVSKELESEAQKRGVKPSAPPQTGVGTSGVGTTDTGTIEVPVSKERG